MARPPRYIPRDTSRRRTFVYLAVGAFVAIDILLIALALGATRGGVDSAAQAVSTPPGAVSTSTPTATPTRTSVAKSVLPVPPTRLLGAVDENTAWRALSGACPATPAAPELTTDGGSTWKTTDATGQAHVTALQSLTATSESIVAMVGLAASDCAPQFVQTFVEGDNYSSYPDKLTRAWFVDPAERATVHSPSGDTEAPCGAVVALAARHDESAAVLCADGTLFTTTDGAGTWSAPTTVPGIVTVAATDEGYLAAAVGTSRCDGVQLLTLTAGLAASPVSCFPTSASPASLSGSVAVSAAANSLWLWCGDDLARSTDGGATWNK